MIVSNDMIISIVEYNLKVRDMEGNVITTLLGHTSHIYDIKVLPYNNIVSISRDRTYRIWDLETLQCINVRHHSAKANNIMILEDKIITSGPKHLIVWK